MLLLEERVVHGLPGGESLLVVVDEQAVDETDDVRGGRESPVVVVDEGGPGSAGVLAKDVVVLAGELDAVAAAVGHEVVGAQDLGDLDQLVLVGVALEEGLLLEDEGGDHRSDGPEVQGVVVLLEVDQELRALVVAGRNAHVEVHARVVELGQPPVDELQLLVERVDHDVLRLHVPVDDAHRVRVVQRDEQLREVEADVARRELRVEDPEVHVVDLLENQRRDLAVLVLDQVVQLHHVRAPRQVLQDLDLPVDLLQLHRLQHLDHARLVVQHVHPGKHLRVLPPPDLRHNLVVRDVSPRYRAVLVVPVLLRPALVHVCVHSRHRVDLVSGRIHLSD